MNQQKVKRKRSPPQGPFLVYCLLHTGGNKDRTYIGEAFDKVFSAANAAEKGQSNNFERRLRQHRKEISGGARYTSMMQNQPGTWNPLFQVLGFQTLRAVLQFELAMKRRKVPVAFIPGKGVIAKHGQNTKKAYTRGPSGKIRQLEYLLHLTKLTNEPHSNFARNGINVRVFISKEEYLHKSGMTEEVFDATRRQQKVAFEFIS